MARFPAYLVALLLMSSAAFAQVASPPPGGVSGVPGVIPQGSPRDTTPKIGTSRIRGRIVAADTGQPLRKAQVRATSAELRLIFDLTMSIYLLIIARCDENPVSWSLLKQPSACAPPSCAAAARSNSTATK
jgi:hypothetical protein